MSVNRDRIAGGLLAAGTSAALLVPMAAPAQAVEVELEARMHATAAFPHARGHAEYESDSHGREFEISVAGVRALAGRRLIVRVHGDVVGRMTVNHDGRAHLDRHGVPRMAAGNVVRVRTGSGRLVTYGVLHRSLED
ncbi:MAG: hypothetical protein ACXVWU_03270 [Nocardioides sp.]